MKIAGIYKITSPTDKVYIGQSWNIRERWRGYKKPSSLKRQPAIDRSIRKYGLQSHCFEIVHELPSDVDQVTLDAYEQLYMDMYRDCNVRLLNAKEAGSKGKHSDETKDKLRQSKLGTKAHPDVKQRMSEQRKGIKKSETHKLNISKSHIGRRLFVEKMTGEKNIKVKLTEQQVLEIRAKHKPNVKKCNKNLANEYGVSVSAVERITGRKTWTHI